MATSGGPIVTANGGGAKDSQRRGSSDEKSKKGHEKIRHLEFLFIFGHWPFVGDHDLTVEDHREVKNHDLEVRHHER